MPRTTKLFSLLVLFVFAATNIALQKAPPPPLDITDQTKLWKVMTSLGKVNTNALYEDQRSDVIKGQQLIMSGYTTNFKGKKTPPTSPKLTCIACHTLELEHPQPSTINPQSRLEHADSSGIPFLPGAPLYGIVNRVAFFTDDYQSIFAHKDRLSLQVGHRDIRKAIQACNIVYGKGRVLDNWEIESILAFLWTMELKVGDLNMPDSIIASIEESIQTNTNNARSVNIMRRYYPEVYPATLAGPIALGERKKISPVLNSFTNGKRVYRQSCLHCHSNKKYAHLKLDSKQKTFQFLKKHFDDTSRYSIYDAIRYSPGSKANRTGLPHYTSQRMSDQQIQDLRFFITQMARLGDEAYEYYKNF